MIVRNSSPAGEYSGVKGQVGQENMAVSQNTGENKEQEKEAAADLGQDTVVYAGTLNLPGDEIEAKREQARDQARRLIDKVWEGERKIDEDLNERREKIDALQEERFTYKSNVLALRSDREALRQQYGVDENSTEEQELRLLEKELDSINPLKDVTMTAEEYQEVLKIRAKGLTEYQKRSLEKFSEMRKWEWEDDKLERQIIEDNAEIRTIRHERLKHNPMAEAKVQAEAILQDASKDIIGMLTDDMREHVDQVAKETEEKAKEQAEKKEEEEELREEAAPQESTETREERKRQQEILEGERDTAKASMEIAVQGSQIQEEIEQMLATMQLLAEDVKGLEVDELL